MRTLIFASLIAGLVGTVAQAQGTGPAGDAGVGAGMFYTFCGSCHGDDGTGGGPMTEILTVQPTDLTQLTARNEGEFPIATVVYRIDGRDPLDAHGGPMPIFGDIFEGDTVAMKTAAGQPILTSQGIADVVAYLLTIQD